MPTGRMDPPPGASPPMRMTASWFGSAWIHRIQVRGAMFRARSRVPLGSVRHLTGVIRRWSFQERPHLAVHRPSACSGVKALRNTSDAKAASRQAALAFRSLDPFRALREPDRRRRDEERPFPLRTKNSQQNPTTISDQLPIHGEKPLDRKSPIQVRICLPPAVSLVRTRLRDCRQ